MLKFPNHQVAGHFAAAGQQGPLIDSNGIFYKPLQSTSRGHTELSFYTSLFNSTTTRTQIPTHILSFFPSFHGTRILTPGPHIVLEDLTHSLTRPNIIDFKIGARTWGPHDEEPYFEKCVQKDRETTSAALGFRVSGLKIAREDGSVYNPERKEVKRFSVVDVRRALREFGDRNVMSEFLDQLNQLKCWFEEQTIWHFYSASVLVIYEKGEKLRVKMIDFAHVTNGSGVIDHNFLGGLCSLIKFVKDAIDEFNEGLAKKDGANLENGDCTE